MLGRRDVLGGGGALLALAACGQRTAAAGVLRVGSQKGGTKALMLASGALAGADYAIEWSEFPAAQTQLEAIGSGAVDLGLAGDAPFLFAYQSGSPIKAVAAQRAARRQEGALSVLVGAGSGVRDLAGLLGKRVATSRGSIGHYLVLRALQANDLPADAIGLVFLAPSDARAALQAGAVDGWATWLPYTAAAIAEGARIVVDARDYSQGYGFAVVNERVLAQKPALLRDFLAREARALRWAQTHVREFAARLASETGLPLAIAEATITKNDRVRVPIDAQLINDQRAVLDTFVRAGAIGHARRLTDAFVLDAAPR